jgi:hypothetical protein
MDLFDLFPVTPPQFPGERSARTPAEQAAAGVGLLLLPATNFVLVLFTGLASHVTIVLVVLPLVSAVVAYLLSRWLSISAGRSILLGFGCATACFIGNACALLLAALGQFYSGF